MLDIVDLLSLIGGVVLQGEEMFSHGILVGLEGSCANPSFLCLVSPCLFNYLVLV